MLKTSELLFSLGFSLVGTNLMCQTRSANLRTFESGSSTLCRLKFAPRYVTPVKIIRDTGVARNLAQSSTKTHLITRPPSVGETLVLRLLHCVCRDFSWRWLAFVCVNPCLLIQTKHFLPLIAVSCNEAGREHRGKTTHRCGRRL